MKPTTKTFQVGNKRLELIPRRRLTIYGYITEWRWKTIAGNNKVIGTSHPEWYRNIKDCVENFRMNAEIANALPHDAFIN